MTTAKLPEDWRYLKLDLFNNATVEDLKQDKNQFVVTLNVQTDADPGFTRFTAMFNSPHRMVRRGVKNWATDPHYQLVEQIMSEMPRDSYAVSKFYDKNHTTAMGLTGFLITDEIDYKFLLVVETEMFAYRFVTNTLSEAQRRKNIIGTTSASTGVTTRLQNRIGKILGTNR